MILPYKFGLSKQTLDKIQQELMKFPKIQKAVIYGSRAKGNYRKGSDIDIAIYGEAFQEKDLLQLEVKLDDLLLPYCIDLCRFESLQTVELKNHIEQVGKILYQP